MKAIKCISLILILSAILFISVLSISAADVNDNATFDISTNDSGYLQDNGGLNLCNSVNESLDNCAAFKNSGFQNNLHINIIEVNGSLEMNQASDIVGQNGSIENNVSGTVDVGGITNSSQYTVRQTSANTFILTFSDNSTLSVCRLGIYDEDSFKKVSNLISKNNVAYDMLIIEFKDKLNLEIEPWTNELLKSKNFKNVIIRGNGATVSIRNPKVNDIRHFLYVGSSDLVALENITLKGFNTAVVNHGKCELKNVAFLENVIDFRPVKNNSWSPLGSELMPFEPAPNHKDEEDYGGAIRNFAILDCEGCSFVDSFAQSGGAIYNYEGTQATLINCNFRGNKVYTCLTTPVFLSDPVYSYDYDGGSRGDARSNIRLGSYSGFDCNNDYDICTCKLASCMVYNDNDKVYFVSINSTGDLMNFINNERSIQYMKYCVLDFLPGKTYNIPNDFEVMKFKNIEILVIRGNGATINVNDASSSEECHFIYLNPSSTCMVQNITFKGFNTVFINKGSLYIQNTTFKSSKCDYVVSEDYGGAIYNYGLLTILDTAFENGYAKYGGAIYNERGIVISNTCNFTSNEAYGKGGAIYNDFGIVISQNCLYTNNCAEDGGAVLNHYGKFNSINDVYTGSAAEDDGGAIYNDYGELIIGNDTFINSRADEGEDVYSYGDEAKFTIASKSYSIQKNAGSVIKETIKVTEDAPSEFARWGIRIAEIVLCVALCIGCSLAGIPEASAGVICFIGGALFAGVEEVIEELCFEHNFNLFNVVMMMGIAGMFDAVTGAIGSWIGLTFFSTATVQLSAKESFKLSAICFAVEVAGEILTEALPRMDFRNLDVPSDLVDPNIPFPQ